jgi:hypothetical protein
MADEQAVVSFVGRLAKTAPSRRGGDHSTSVPADE